MSSRILNILDPYLTLCNLNISFYPLYPFYFGSRSLIIIILFYFKGEFPLTFLPFWIRFCLFLHKIYTSCYLAKFLDTDLSFGGLILKKLSICSLLNS